MAFTFFGLSVQLAGRNLSMALREHHRRSWRLGLRSLCVCGCVCVSTFVQIVLLLSLPFSNIPIDVSLESMWTLFRFWRMFLYLGSLAASLKPSSSFIVRVALCRLRLIFALFCCPCSYEQAQVGLVPVVSCFVVPSLASCPVIVAPFLGETSPLVSRFPRIGWPPRPTKNYGQEYCTSWGL